MEEYISRQAAIDALAKHEKSKGHNYTLFVDIVSECAEIIRDLPSAEPTQTNVSNALNALDYISRQAAIDLHCEICERRGRCNPDICVDMELFRNLPSAQPEQRPLTEDDYAYCEECDPEVKCLSCGHRIAERPLEVYCNIMCKWVNEKDCCTMFEPGQGKMKKTEAQI